MWNYEKEPLPIEIGYLPIEITTLATADDFSSMPELNDFAPNLMGRPSKPYVDFTPSQKIYFSLCQIVKYSANVQMVTSNKIFFYKKGY